MGPICDVDQVNPASSLASVQEIGMPNVCAIHLEYFKRYGVKCVIRCNEPKYDAQVYIFLYN